MSELEQHISSQAPLGNQALMDGCPEYPEKSNGTRHQAQKGVLLEDFDELFLSDLKQF